MVISETLFNMIKAWAFNEHGVRPKDLIRVIKERPKILRDMPVYQTSELFDLFFVLPIGEAEVKESYKLIVTIQPPNQNPIFLLKHHES